MNSRERIIAAIEHRQPDRVPLDLGSTPSTGISAAAYNNLKRHLDISGGYTRVYDVVQQVAEVEKEILDMFGADVVDVGITFHADASDWYDIFLDTAGLVQFPAWFNPDKKSDGSYEAFLDDGTLIGKMPKGATFFDQTCFPYLSGYPSNYDGLDEAMGKVVWSALAHSPWDAAGDAAFYDRLRENAIHLRENTDRAIMIVCGCNLFEWGTFLRRMDNFIMDIYTDRVQVERFLDALMERHMETLRKVCDAVGDVVDILRFGDDLGMDTGPFMSPQKYREIFKPRHKMLCDYVHSHSDMKTFLHSCGSIYQLMGDLIEAGYDIINPVQTSSRDMDPVVLKREFGRDITFWGGGCNTRSVLNMAKPEEVYQYTRRMLDIFMPGGGYVFNQEHNILPDVPPENIIAMYRAVGDFS